VDNVDSVNAIMDLIKKAADKNIEGIVFHKDIMPKAEAIKGLPAGTLHHMASGQFMQNPVANLIMGHVHDRPDVDIDMACNLMDAMEIPRVKFEYEGVEYEFIGRDDDYRYIVYDKQIQFVRNVESFVSYHEANPGSLKRMMANQIRAQFLTESMLVMMYNNCHSNEVHTRPVYQDPKLHQHKFYRMMPQEVPLKVLVELSLKWLQGIIVETFGVQGFDIIKEAKAEAAKKLSLGRN
jgi:hypothetical protein